MFHTRTLDGPGRLVELTDTQADSLAVLAPDRGGMVARFSVAGSEILYMDEASFADPPKSVRGGVPILFPSPGQLAGDTWSQGGKHGHLRRHGFARDLPWSLVRTDGATAATATLRLASNEGTLPSYPWKFELDYTYSLRGRALSIEQRVQNRGHSPMPYGAGLHPYFRVPHADKAGVRITSPAARAFDNVHKREVTLARDGASPVIDLTAKEVDLHLLDHGPSPASLTWGQRTITVTSSPELSHWVVWTLAGWDFVCLEPWTCPGNALNTGERLLWLGPGEVHSLTTTIDVTG